MKKSEMVCRKCIKFEDDECHLESVPLRLLGDWECDPDTHWCAQGQWLEWSERHQCWVSYHWGENDDKEPTKVSDDTRCLY